jgi:excisionase family DNA binding protein
MARLLAQLEEVAFVAALDGSEFPGFAAVQISAEVFMKQDARSATLLTVKDVMRELNLGRTKVYELIKTEGLPVVRFGRAVRVPMASLQQWISEREEQCLSA